MHTILILYLIFQFAWTHVKHCILHRDLYDFFFTITKSNKSKIDPCVQGNVGSLTFETFQAAHCTGHHHHLECRSSLRQQWGGKTLTRYWAVVSVLLLQVGLGVAQPAALLVSQDFFAELRLPYSVKRGERFPLNVTIFNYIDVSLIGTEIAPINGL